MDKKTEKQTNLKLRIAPAEFGVQAQKEKTKNCMNVLK